MSVCVVGVILSERVCFPSNRTGVLVWFGTLMVLFLMEARVGGGQLDDFCASITISWSGSSVWTESSSPGIIIFLDFIETSGVLVEASGFMAVLHGTERLLWFPDVEPGPLIGGDNPSRWALVKRPSFNVTGDGIKPDFCRLWAPGRSSSNPWPQEVGVVELSLCKCLCVVLCIVL